MTEYRTYMSVTLHSEGAKLSDITRVMEELGWKPVYGAYDFAYEWDKKLVDEGNFEEYCKNINTVHDSLSGLNVSFNIRTFEQGKEEFTTINCW